MVANLKESRNNISNTLDNVEERISEPEEWSIKLPKLKEREKKIFKNPRFWGSRLSQWSLDVNKGTKAIQWRKENMFFGKWS